MLVQVHVFGTPAFLLLAVFYHVQLGLLCYLGRSINFPGLQCQYSHLLGRGVNQCGRAEKSRHQRSAWADLAVYRKGVLGPALHRTYLSSLAFQRIFGKWLLHMLADRACSVPASRSSHEDGRRNCDIVQRGCWAQRNASSPLQASANNSGMSTLQTAKAEGDDLIRRMIFRKSLTIESDSVMAASPHARNALEFLRRASMLPRQSRSLRNRGCTFKLSRGK